MTSNTGDPVKLKLWCRVDGYKPDTVFAVTIAPDSDVHELRHLIVELVKSFRSPKIAQVGFLELWKVSKSDSI
jgi:methionine aminopeptidase